MEFLKHWDILVWIISAIAGYVKLNSKVEAMGEKVADMKEKLEKYAGELYSKVGTLEAHGAGQKEINEHNKEVLVRIESKLDRLLEKP